jgi:hypothetical protein
MAVTAKFVADFSDFNTGVKGAEKQIDSFTQQVDKAGGRLMDVRGYRDSTAAAGGFATELRKVDGLLAQAGVNIGPQIRAVADLGEMVGKTAGQVGVLGTALGLASAAMTGWNIGRFIADLTGSDQIVADFINKLRGFKPGAEEAAAGADVLALASERAGYEITDFNVAMKFNRDYADKMAAGQEKVAAATRATADAVHAAVEATVAASNRATAATVDRAKAERDMWNDIGVGRMEYEAAQQAATEREAAQLRAFYNEMGVLAQNAWSPEPIVDWIEAIEEIAPAVQDAADAVRDFGQATHAAGVGPNPSVGGSVAGMAPTWNQNQVARYGAGGYLGTGSPINININGSVLGNKDEIARVVGDAVTSSYRTGGNRLPV